MNIPYGQHIMRLFDKNKSITMIIAKESYSVNCYIEINKYLTSRVFIKLEFVI